MVDGLDLPMYPDAPSKSFMSPTRMAARAKPKVLPLVLPSSNGSGSSPAVHINISMAVCTVMSVCGVCTVMSVCGVCTVMSVCGVYSLTKWVDVVQ
jgi:hypothetical protein